ncbi:MAG TPA: hypothetical protein VFT12_00060 [Thermoanaerobaculia bacterium]|nr:hypothetical protein [Thermoanaerobaculia bacterium]
MDENIRSNSGSTAAGARDKVRSKAAEAAGKAKEKISDQYDAKKEVAMNEIQHLASALRSAATNVGNEGSSMSAMLLNRAAERLDSVGSSFSGKDLDGIFHDVERLARRNPAVFLGGAMLIGFAASRFLKSSGHHGGDFDIDRGYAFDRSYEVADLPDYGSDLRGTGTGFGTPGSSASGGGGNLGGL